MLKPLQIEKLEKRYGSATAVKGVSFEILPGEIFGLLGPNGAGKTSIISILVNLEKATSGRALIFGTDSALGDRECKSSIGLVPQEIVSHGFFTVQEVLEFHSGYYGLTNNGAQIDFLCNRLGLAEHRHKRVRQLSGGMKRRLLIAKALVHQPKLLLLDEPTAGVDIGLRNSLWEFVRELNDNGTSILLTTHYLQEAENLCHRVGILHRGQLLKVGETKSLVRELTTRELKITLEQPVHLITNEHLTLQSDTELVFRLPAQLSVGTILQDIPCEKIKNVQVDEGSLEDAFLKIVETTTP